MQNLCLTLKLFVSVVLAITLTSALCVSLCCQRERFSADIKFGGNGKVENSSWSLFSITHVFQVYDETKTKTKIDPRSLNTIQN